MKKYKIIVVGDGGVGKTSLLNYLLNIEFNSYYIPTHGANVQIIKYNDDVLLEFWECGGKDEGLRDGYYINADACIIMFDVTQRKSFYKMDEYFKDIQRVCPKIPIVVCGNKNDENLKHTHYLDRKIIRTYNIVKYLDISVKNKFRCEDIASYIISRLK